MVTPPALVGGGEVRTPTELTLPQWLHLLLAHTSPASVSPFTVRASLGPERPCLYTPALTHNVTTSCPDPSQRPGPATYWSSPPFGPHISQTPQSVRNWALHPTHLLLPQGSLLSKGTTTYQVMHTSPLNHLLLFTSQIYPSTSYCHHPSPCPITSFPPTSLRISYPCSLPTVVWPVPPIYRVPSCPRAFARANSLCAASLPGSPFCLF